MGIAGLTLLAVALALLVTSRAIRWLYNQEHYAAEAFDLGLVCLLIGGILTAVDLFSR